MLCEMPLVSFLRLSSVDLCKHTTVAYFSLRAFSGPPTSIILVIILGLMVCALLEIVPGGVPVVPRQ